MNAFTAFADPFSRLLAAQEAPNTARVLARLTTDIAAAYDDAKEEFGRLRPFATRPALPTSAIGAAGMDRLAQSKSYPSRHAAFGWAWALLFAQALPERADALFDRGRAYGDSRVVCGFHYPCDVEAGRLVGAAVVARPHGDRAFARDFAIMQSELRSLLGQTGARSSGFNGKLNATPRVRACSVARRSRSWTGTRVIAARGRVEHGGRWRLCVERQNAADCSHRCLNAASYWAA